MKPAGTIPQRLEVVLKNVRAVREICNYLFYDGDLAKDLGDARQALCRHLEQSPRMPDTWHAPYVEKDRIQFHPHQKWTRSKLSIGIDIVFPDPAPEQAEDRDPSVNLYVPPWRLRKEFTKRRKHIAPKATGWKHLSQQAPDEFSYEWPLSKRILYETFVGPKGFDAPGLFAAITKAVRELVEIEPEIDRLYAKLTIGTRSGERK